MPTKKQRRRALKERRHEYETVWVDAEGNELEEPPEESASAPPEKRDGAKPKPKQKATQQRGGRPVRVPPPPSWQLAAKRALIIGAVIFVFFYVAGAKSGGNRLGFAIEITALYTLLFIPFTYMIDRFAHNRWQRRADEQAGKRGPAKKR
jgi:hypothetical protein